MLAPPHFFVCAIPVSQRRRWRVSCSRATRQLKSTASVAVVGSKTAFETYNAAAGEDKLEVIDPFAQEIAQEQ